MGCHATISKKPRNGPSNTVPNSESQTVQVETQKVDNQNQAPSPQQVQVKIVASMNGNNFFEGTYKDDILIELIINDIKKIIPDSNPIFNYNYLFRSKDLSELGKNQLKQIITANNGFTKTQTVNTLSIEVTKCGLEDLPLNIRNEFDKNNFVCKPLNDPLEIVIFDKKTGKVNIELIDDNMEPSLRGISDHSAYCSGDNHLFVSGGDKFPKHFWSFNISKNSIYCFDNMKCERRLHSMIYVPNKYVFIVGGRGTKIVEYFDTKSNEFVRHSELNEERSEPSLSLIDDTYLYAFTGFNAIPKYTDKFERINLRSKSKTWEAVKPIIDPNYPPFTQIYFASVTLSPTEILFVGGMHIPLGVKEECSFIYDHKKNLLKKSDLKFEKYVFFEKSFYPVDKTNSILIHNETREKTTLLRIFDNKIEEVILEDSNDENVHSSNNNFQIVKKDIVQEANNQAIKEDNKLDTRAVI